ncbi:four-carbon acid sugar kinase family protein [Mesorhizobium sp. M7A.F.Ca.US.001.02.1.1]|uniref:four-carbon acid sugar kinase family protein n=1 Tax=Mesorhizobium sp. M7A.F.Ca.US.001.02.1.1 TaxID=2496703 RepID=UPI000FD49513|nr:four-carbon acid sugar kinase family protein [Mesorhizobium sp. M7A.F.Ca.US.001.02.1.1]RVA01854.1 four-carbon acid sugar kinase family protein [Mesorhizobium sp. M7A.F.Ca.US.001.02.1.1]
MRTNHQPSIAVLANDLTSAADGAAPFVARGLTASIGRGQLPRQAEAAAIIAVDSGSRSATASQAFEAVARLTARLASRTVLYKTVDSTLRGHITAELEACFAASGRKALVFAPAFPQPVVRMAAALSRRFVPAKTLPPLLDGISSDVLVVIGSANLRSQRQADQLQKVRGVMLLRGPRTREWDSAAVLRRIAQDAARELQSPRFGALIATGGDTMEAILDLLKVREFDILQELDPGFPLGLARLGDGRSLLLAMKAGGFGSDDAVTRAVARIRGATQ